MQPITELYLIAKEWSEHEKQVSADQVDKETMLSVQREIKKMLLPQCEQRTEFPIIVYDFPDPVCPYAKTQAL